MKNTEVHQHIESQVREIMNTHEIKGNPQFQKLYGMFSLVYFMGEEEGEQKYRAKLIELLESETSPSPTDKNSI